MRLLIGKILTDAFGEDFREKLEASAADVRDRYQPLLDLLPSVSYVA